MRLWRRLSGQLLLLLSVSLLHLHGLLLMLTLHLLHLGGAGFLLLHPLMVLLLLLRKLLMLLLLLSGELLLPLLVFPLRFGGSGPRGSWGGTLRDVLRVNGSRRSRNVGLRTSGHSLAGRAGSFAG